MADLAKILAKSRQIADYCRKWGLRELALFGSVLRDDFGPASDIDVLVDLLPDSKCSLWDVPDMSQELEAILGQQVDVVFKGGLKNPFMRQEILGSCRVLYAA
jgi:predicted nucleotidyltransferase